MESPKLSSLILSLYIPVVLSVATQGAPVTSYIIAWLGSFYIFYQTWISSKRFVVNDLPLHKQIMRPIFLQQFVFAGYMCCTSFFFFLDSIGYRYFEQVQKLDFETISQRIELAARCQRLSLLGHAAMVTGLLWSQRALVTLSPAFKPITSISRETWIVRVGIISLIVSFIVRNIPALFQFSLGLYNVAIISGAFILVYGIVKTNIKLLAWGGGIFIINLLNASLTGYKEPIIVNFIILACLLYPHYKKAVLIAAVPVFSMILYVAPTYSTIIRKQSWQGETSAEQAREDALEFILQQQEEETEVEDMNWRFLTDRFSEIGMFTKYAKNTPEFIPYYNTEILQNSIIAIIPRALWSDKPITEELAMQRVYDAGVVDTRSKVSAKTRPVVDAYLSFGAVGILVYMFALGTITQWLSNKAEELFGGYEIGCAIMFNGFFQILWRGETTEFMMNTVFWGFIALLLFFICLRFTNYMEKIS